MANRECGISRLIRGATIIEKAITSKKPQPSDGSERLVRAATKQIIPKRTIIHFAYFRWGSLFITGDRSGTVTVVKQTLCGGCNIHLKEFNTFNTKKPYKIKVIR